MRYTAANTIEAGNPVRVFVNGNEVEGPLVADTKRGEVIYAPAPARVKKNADVIYTRMLRGVVTVEPAH